MSKGSAIDSGIEHIARLISLIGLLGLLIFAFITVGEVLLRWLFNYPIMGVSDVSSLVITVVLASCFPLVVAKKRNITVRISGKLLGKPVHDILESFGTLVTLGMFVLISWQLWVYAADLKASSQTTWVVLWPMSPWYKVAAIFMALCVPILLRILFLQVKSIGFRDDELSSDKVAEKQNSGVK